MSLIGWDPFSDADAFFDRMTVRMPKPKPKPKPKAAAGKPLEVEAR